MGVQKAAMRLFGALLQRAPALGLRESLLGYVRSHFEIVELLVQGCGRPTVALHCGLMLRSLCSEPSLVDLMLRDSDVLLSLLDFAGHHQFDVSSDAFASLRELLLKH